MTNAEVFSAFASRQAAKGGSVRVERTDKGVVLYSYATPIAFLTDAMSTPVFTNRRFSQTTSKQQGQAKRVFSGDYIGMDNDEFRTEATKVGAYFGMAR